jgi:hypothetical protein
MNTVFVKPAQVTPPPPVPGTVTLIVFVVHVVGLEQATTWYVDVTDVAPAAASVSDGVAVVGAVGAPTVGALRVQVYVTPALGEHPALSVTVPPALVIGLGTVVADGVHTGAAGAASLQVTVTIACPDSGAAVLVT